MPNLKNIIKGRVNKKKGEIFERILHLQAYKNHWVVVPIPSGCKQISATKIIRVKTPFDFFFVKKGKAAFIDAKLTKSKSFSFADLTQHQVLVLKKIEDENFKAGYIINFETLNKTAFFSGNLLYKLNRNSSLKPEDGVIIGDNSNINIDTIFDYAPQGEIR